MNQIIDAILVPVVGFITNTISLMGYSGVALLMAIESAAIPLPPEVIMPFSGFVGTFRGRVLPFIRTYFSIPAGISRVPFWSFTLSCFVGSFIWSYFLGWIGFKLGENWSDVRHTFRQVDWILALVILAGLSWWIVRHIRNRIRN